tara:strand:+ start:26599 stop:27015 length:417 start_codon:yes stop_codon:yes gene_type:complete
MQYKLATLAILATLSCSEKPVIQDYNVKQSSYLCGNNILDEGEQCEGDIACIDCKVSPTYLYGDYDLDQDVDKADAQCAANVAVGKDNCLKVSLYHADLYCDGVIDVSEAVIILQRAKNGKFSPETDSNYNGIPDCKE